ncbi:chemotaxis protein CheW [Vulgatibacter sp.]|uniref:chemotaxis protein CheW n=1 Tax=Vulgatibacter sp. TaxID=1971226 RepID=UPI00356241BF
MAEVDWAALRQRLHALGEALEGRRDPAASEALLRARARRLAAVSAEREEAATARELLVVRLGGERYALAAGDVIEVVRRRDLAPVPGVPPQVAGVFGYRGEVLAAFDLRRVLGLDTRNAADRLVVIGGDHAEMALLAEEVEEVIAVDEAAIEATSLSREELVRGLAPGGLLVLDTQGLLHDPRLFVG